MWCSRPSTRDAPASISPRVTQEAIRGAIGFDGLLMSDDLAMKALSGSVAERAAAVLAAGSDVVLACNGGLAESESVALVAPALQGAALARYERARAVLRQQQPFEVRRGGGLRRRGFARRRLNQCNLRAE